MIANTAYEPIAHVKAGNGLQMDIHELYITPEGQAWIIAVEPVCLPECNEEHVPVFDDEIQEIDIKTGLVMWSWHAMGHVPIGNSEIEPANGVFDPYHTNSIQALPEHRVLLSMRDTSGVYEVEQGTGKVLWEISPNHDTFKLKRGVLFHFQHDARLEGRHLETLTLFDDEAGPPLYGPSKGLVLKIKGKSVKLVHAYENPRHTLAVAEGSMQVLPGGEALVELRRDPVLRRVQQERGKEEKRQTPVRSRTAQGRRYLPRDAVPVVGDAEHQARGRGKT